MGNQKKINLMPCRRLFATETFYTRPKLAKQLLALKDGEENMVDKVSMDLLMYAVNLSALKREIGNLKQAERDSLVLVNNLDKDEGI